MRIEIGEDFLVATSRCRLGFYFIGAGRALDSSWAAVGPAWR
jgi:hypothetical protein